MRSISMVALAMAALAVGPAALPAIQREKPAGKGAESRREKKKAQKLARRKNRTKKG